MSPDEATNAIFARIAAGGPYGPAGELIADWTLAPLPGPRNLILPSEPVHEPSGGVWATVFVSDSIRERVGFPSRTFLVYGRIECAIYTPLGIGGYLARSVAGDLARAIDVGVIDDVTYMGSAVRSVPPDPRTKWVEMEVRARFRYTDTGRP